MFLELVTSVFSIEMSSNYIVPVPPQLVVVHQKLEVELILQLVQQLPHLVQALILSHLPALGLMPTV